jgi:hypothetical protein
MGFVPTQLLKLLSTDDDDDEILSDTFDLRLGWLSACAGELSPTCTEQFASLPRSEAALILSSIEAGKNCFAFNCVILANPACAVEKEDLLL